MGKGWDGSYSARMDWTDIFCFIPWDWDRAGAFLWKSPLVSPSNVEPLGKAGIVNHPKKNLKEPFFLMRRHGGAFTPPSRQELWDFVSVISCFLAWWGLVKRYNTIQEELIQTKEKKKKKKKNDYSNTETNTAKLIVIERTIYGTMIWCMCACVGERERRGLVKRYNTKQEEFKQTEKEKKEKQLQSYRYKYKYSGTSVFVIFSTNNLSWFSPACPRGLPALFLAVWASRRASSQTIPFAFQSFCAIFIDCEC